MVLAWWTTAGSLTPSIRDTVHRHTVAFDARPYKGHDDHSVHENIKYILDKYGSHAASSKYQTSIGKSVMLFCIYDSYLTPAESWANLLTPSGSLLVEEGHKHNILSAGYTTTYTYFASKGFSFGSTHQNWKAVKTFCDSNNLMFIPTAGPSYINSSIRPWSSHNTQSQREVL
uniref:Uncharacterized protein n=1 Tax=Falco tinnunculus TaxID=100819 RepID=A0A8C4UI04_FALTI